MRAGTIRGPMRDPRDGWYGSTHPASSRSPLYISRRIPNHTGIGGGERGRGRGTNRSRSGSVPLNDRRFVDPDLSAPCAKLNAPELERTNRVIRRQRSDTIIRSFLCPNLSDEGRAGWSCAQVPGRPETIPRPVSMVSSRELQIRGEGPRVTRPRSGRAPTVDDERRHEARHEGPQML
jgi:hypothetical protein